MARRGARTGAVALAALALSGGAGAGGEEGISGARAKKVVAEIARLGPRPAGSQAELRAGAIVARQLRALGYRVVMQRFALPGGGVSRNVVAVPTEPVRALVVAHVDGVHDTAAANDNASGVAVLLEVAGVLRERDDVMFVATGAEERVVTGSRIHLGSQRILQGLSKVGRKRIRIALALDMVGVGDRLHVRGLEESPNRSARLTLAAGPRATYLRDRGESDHAELTRGGLPAAWIQWRYDDCWHEPCDRPSRVRAAKLEAAARLTYEAVRRAIVAQ
jgi:hypothetical protein